MKLRKKVDRIHDDVVRVLVYIWSLLHLYHQLFSR